MKNFKNTQHDALDAVANINGGGLSVSVTGKYTSVRHERAKLDGKYTAGEAAAVLSKFFGKKIYAKDIRPLATEWHHSGFYAGKMGKTWFFAADQVEALKASLPSQLKKIEEEKAEKIAEEARLREQKVTGIYYCWSHDYSGRYGKKVNHKVLATYSGDALSTPQNFIPCTAEQLACAQLFEGRKYYGWAEPALSEFTPEVFSETIKFEKKRLKSKCKANSIAKKMHNEKMAIENAAILKAENKKKVAQLKATAVVTGAIIITEDVPVAVAAATIGVDDIFEEEMKKASANFYGQQKSDRQEEIMDDFLKRRNVFIDAPEKYFWKLSIELKNIYRQTA